MFPLHRDQRVQAAQDVSQAAAELAEPDAAAETALAVPPDPAELSARIDELRRRFDLARSVPLEAVLILGDAERVARELKDGCLRLGLGHAAEALGLLGTSLRRAELLNPVHMDLLQLELEAVRALFRLDPRPAAAHAEELLRTLRLAARQQFEND